MIKKEKLQHIWYYYKWHMIGGVFGLWMIISLLVSIFGPKPPEPGVYAAFVGKYINTDQMMEIEQQAAKEITKSPEKSPVKIECFYIDKEKEDQMTVAMMQKFMAMISAKQLDIIAAPESQFQEQAAQGMYMPLEEISQLQPLLEKMQEKLVKATTEEDPKENVYGIKIDASDKVGVAGEDAVDTVIGIAVNTEKQQNAVAFLEWIVQK
jgi:hypothetical protein